MNSAGFMLATAVKNLRRGGQRVFVAVLCIAFGVMSLVAMTLLSQALERMLVIEPALLVGADISMTRHVEDVILPEHEAGLQALQKDGIFESYTLVAYTSSLAFRLPDSNELYFPSAGIGIDPANYPLVGAFVTSTPGNVGLSTLLQEAGDILITKDIALLYGLKEGDRLTLSNIEVGQPLEARIRAIVTETPNHQGSKIYYNLETAKSLANGGQMLNTALVTARDPAMARDRLQQTGWNVFLATELALGDKQVQEMFEVSLQGAAILGLLVGGIGIANTMQVLLRRRRREVAIWKTLGYREGHIQTMFAIEAALLGGLGSLIGAVLGTGLSYSLVDMFSRTSTLLISWQFSPVPVFTGIWVGTLTTVLFSMLAIVATSRVQPVALLRNEPVPATRLGCLQNGILIVLVALPFAAITSLVMGSVLKGMGVLILALAGLVGLGGFLGGLLWVSVRIIPLRALPLVNMARNNLRRRGAGLVYAMIALFVGVVALAMGGIITINAEKVVAGQAQAFADVNLAIVAPASQEVQVYHALEAQGVTEVRSGYQTSVKAIRLNDPAASSLSAVLIARQEPSEYELTGAAWGSVPDGVYVFSYLPVEAGASVEVTLWDGSVHTLPVAGSYMFDPDSLSVGTIGGLLLPNELSQRLVPPDTIRFYAQVPGESLPSTTSALSQALPESTVIDLVLYNARFSQVYRNLFVLIAAMAGLALLAGMLLIANSVSIAMIDRRYEIGVLKTVGYQRGHVLLTLVVEYSLVALLASVAALGVVNIFLAFVRMAEPVAAFLFTMPFSFSAIIALVCIGLTLLTVLLVTLEPTRVSPVVVLNDRD